MNMADFQSTFTSLSIAESAPEWDLQRERIRLARTLMGGTKAMQDAGEEYLPRRADEPESEYQNRLKRSKLNNKYKQTLAYLVGQVFQKQITYQEATEGKEVEYDTDFFGDFQEDVDTQGTNISMFGEKVFRAGMMDGVTFILSEYPTVLQVSDDEGRVYVENEQGDFVPRTAQSDTENNWRPYWVHVKAGQVLDAWLDSVGGETVLRTFRYRETYQRENDDGLRVTVQRIRAIFQTHWEVWEQPEEGDFELVSSGENSLGIVPVDWFMPGEQIELVDGSGTAGLSAIPTLDDIAYINLEHWEENSNHRTLMQNVRAPGFLFNGIEFPRDTKSGDFMINWGPGKFLAALPSGTGIPADVKTISIDTSSVEQSFHDLQMLEERMDVYALSLAQSKGQITATQMQIAAISSNASLKGWVQKLQDCLENAIRKIALWVNKPDGPPLHVNDNFTLMYDPSELQQLASLVDRGLMPLFCLYEWLKKRGKISEDMTYDDYVLQIEQDKKRREMIDYTPSFAGRLQIDRELAAA